MIEELQAKLVDVKSQASTTARELEDCQYRAKLDIARLQDELMKLRDRYDRLGCISADCKMHVGS